MTAVARVRDFSWNVKDAGHFDFLQTKFDLWAAKKILVANGDRKLQTIDVYDWTHLLSSRVQVIKFSVEIDWEKALGPTIRLDVPVIVARLSRANYLVIDGWHRIAKASRTNVTQLPAAILTVAETNQIMFTHELA